MSSSKRSLWACALFLLSVLITGCSDSSSDSSAPPPNANHTRVTLSLSFPDPIEGALVYALSHSGEALTQTHLTNHLGEVTLELPDSHSQQPVIFTVQGGYQPSTGHDFSGLSMQFERVATEQIHLDLSSYFADPAAITAGTAANWQQSYILASVLHILRGTEDPVKRIKDQQQISTNQATWLNGLMHHFHDDDVRWPQLNYLLELAQLDATLTTATEIKSQHLQFGLQHYLEERLHTSRLNTRQQNNLSTLSRHLLTANHQRGLQPETPALLNLARALASQHILSADALNAENYQVNLGHLDIQALASSRLIDPRQPLASAELLGHNEQQRRLYFLNSTLSPYQQLNTWVQDVLDDDLQSQAQSYIAMGMASGGLIDEALEIINSRLYHPAQRAQALRRVGHITGQQGNKEQAIAIFDLALSLYTDNLRQSKGIVNMDANDALFYQTLSRNYQALGEQARAEAALAAVNEFLESQAGVPYNTAWGRILTGVWRIAEADVEEAEERGLSPSAVAQARSSVDLFKRFTDQSGPMLDNNGQLRDRTCHSVQTMHVVNYTNFYARLHLNASAASGIQEFERLAQISCNYIAHGANLSSIAEAYNRLGWVDRYLDLINNTLDFSVDDNVTRRNRSQENALAAISLAVQVNRIIANPSEEVIDSAIATTLAGVDDLNQRLEQLTYLGQNKLSPYLALSLIRAGELTAARQVLDAAWELATSDAYLNQYATDPLRLVPWGCSKVAELYQEIDDRPEAQNKMRQCARLAEGRLGLQTTLQQRLTRQHLANGLQRLQLTDEALQQAEEYLLLANISSDAATRIQGLQTSAQLFTQLNREDRAEPLLSHALSSINSLPRSTDNEIKARISSLRNQARAHRDIIQQVRRLPRVTQLNPTDRLLLERQADLALARIQEGLNLTRELANPTDQASYSHDLQDILVQVGHFQHAANTARSHRVDAVRIAALKRLAKELANWDAFPGTQVAQFDFDGDGRPDFFSPLATEEEIINSGLQLDDDIDGDGVLDTQDTTPYCSHC